MKKQTALWMAWISSILAMAGSLTWSLFYHWTPCDLCWYQRICMYPLVAILLVGLLTNDKKVFWYAMPLTVVGFCLAAYNYGIQINSILAKTDTFCSLNNPCTIPEFKLFGFITPPFFALVGFLVIGVLVYLSKRNMK